MAPSGSASGASPRTKRGEPAHTSGPRVGDAIEVEIDRLELSGHGLGRVDRGADDPRAPMTPTEVDVAGVLPGERVLARVDHVDRRGFVFASLVRVLRASPDRVEPACPRFLTCGGCDLLHAPLSVQHALKRELVAKAVGVPVDRVDPVVSSPRTTGYRALAKLVVGPKNVLGSYRPRSHDVADMSGCVVHAIEVEVVVDALRELLRGAGEGVRGLRYVLARASIAEGRVVVLFVVRSEHAGIRELAEELAARDDVATIALQVNDSSGDELLGSAPIEVLVEKAPEPRERIGPAWYRLRPGAFAQVNPLAAAELYGRAAMLAEPEGKVVLDLYSGSGGLALALSHAGARLVVAVEPVRSSVEAGRESAEVSAPSPHSVLFLAKSAEDALGELAGSGATFDVVVLNPPRKGASEVVIDGIARLRPERVVYVSCGPDTLGRDLVRLSASGYRVERVVPVDLFPMTRHVETIVLATRT